MIKTINGGAYLKVSSHVGPYIDSYSVSASQGGVGQMRFNPNSQTIEVWNGNSWLNIVGHADIQLNEEAVQLLNWARTERDRQLRYAELAKTNVTIADALESVKDAELRLRELAILCEEGETNKYNNS